jgi:hypothetical protein
LELLCFIAEALQVESGTEPWQLDLPLLAHQVEKVGIDIQPFRFLNEFHQAAQPFAGVFQNRRGDVLPEFICPDFNDYS